MAQIIPFPADAEEPELEALSREELLAQAQEHGAQVYLCGITVAAVDAMPAYLKLGIRTFSAEPAALLPLKKLLMEQELTQ